MPAPSLASRVAAVTKLGDRARDSDDEKLAHHYLVYLGLLMSCGGLVWGAICVYFGLLVPAVLPFGYIVLTALNLWYFGRAKNFRLARFFQLLISLLLPFLLQWSLGGFVASGAVMLWAVVALLGSLISRRIRFSLGWLAAYLALTLFSGLIDATVRRFAIATPPGVSTLLFVLNIAITSAMVFGLSIYLLAKREEARLQIADMTSLLKKMFGRYHSTEVMNALLENPAALELGGERRAVTIMMTDLRGFTALSERLQPEQVVQLLNIYFEAMVEIALKYNGTVNEIVGDALLIVFGAPRAMPDRARRAVACAIEMQNAMAEVNARNRAQGLPELEMGIGLNDTEVIVGNIGSSERSKYAVVGSGVNITSRIESYTVGGQVFVSESVREAAGDALRIDGQRDVLPKGSEAPIRIYEVGAISAPYHLVLAGTGVETLPLALPLALRYAPLEDADAEGRMRAGSVRRLSRRSAELEASAPLETMANLRMNLEGVDAGLSSKEFYAKVMRRLAGADERYLVHFTSLPPEVDAYFQALLKCGCAAPAAG